MAILLGLLRELPDPVYAELRGMGLALGDRATAEEMLAAAGRLSPATHEAALALLITHLREEILAARAAAEGVVVAGWLIRTRRRWFTPPAGTCGGARPIPGQHAPFPRAPSGVPDARCRQRAAVGAGPGVAARC